MNNIKSTPKDKNTETYSKPTSIAKNQPTGNFVAGCPVNQYSCRGTGGCQNPR